LARDAGKIRDVQSLLLEPPGKPGVLLWPYHDLPPDHLAFVAANLATLAGVWIPDPESVFFNPERELTESEWAEAVARVPEGLRRNLAPGHPKNRAAAVLRMSKVLLQQ